MFGEKSAGDPGASRPPRASRRADSPDSHFDSAPASRGGSRRDIVHVVLRETMRQHGIPSDWIECRTLSMVRADRSSGTYVTLIVRGGQDRLLPYVPAFQASLRQALARFDPHLDDWLRSLAWEFEGAAAADPAPLDSRPAPIARGDLQRGLEVRELGDPAAAMPPGSTPAASADDLEADLRALFAIRDAALAEREDARPEFQATRPG